MPEPTQRRERLVPVAASLLLGAVVFVVAGSWTGPDVPAAWPMALFEVIASGSIAALWFVMALGFGCVVQPLLAPRAGDPWAARWVLGIAVALALDAWLTWLPILAGPGGVAAWLLVALGGAALLRARDDMSIPRPTLAWLWVATAPAIALLLVASASAPGWLWSTEFGGYDALSYHLQLPKEWLAIGHARTLEHNVYSALPGFVESAYMQLMAMRGGATRAAVACQYLHAGFVVLTAWLAARAAHRWWSGSDVPVGIASPVAAVAIVATPWTIVVGSLAYNEMAVTALLAGALLLLLERDDPAWRRGAAIGLVAAAACGAKLTAIGFAVAPLVAAEVVLLLSPRQRLGANEARATGGPLSLTPSASRGPVPLLVLFMSAVITGIIVLLPWMARNAMATGNPFFPFLGSLFGTGSWTAEQVDLFAAAHAAPIEWSQRPARLWDMLFRFGWGANPAPGEPWTPQWTVLPWFALAGIVVGLARRASRPAALALAVMVLIQLLFWVSATHLQSRFLLPVVVPSALLAGLLLAWIVQAMRARSSVPGVPRGVIVILTLGLILWSLSPAFVFSGERDGRPAAAIGREEVLDGTLEQRMLVAASPAERTTILQQASPAFVINSMIPTDGKALLVGDATPWRYRRNVEYTTVWDRGPLSRAIAAAPDDPEAWIDALRDAGFTHVVIEPSMLERWRRSGWLDPMITPERILALAQHGVLIHRSATGRLVMALPPAGT